MKKYIVLIGSLFVIYMIFSDSETSNNEIYDYYEEDLVKIETKGSVSKQGLIKEQSLKAPVIEQKVNKIKKNEGKEYFRKLRVSDDYEPGLPRGERKRRKRLRWAKKMNKIKNKFKKQRILKINKNYQNNE